MPSLSVTAYHEISAVLIPTVIKAHDRPIDMVYDLHAHILPGVDDGARIPDETVDMARVAAEDGTKVILATPHRKDVTESSSVGHIRKLTGEMNTRIAAEGIDLTLQLGMENHLDLELPQDYSNGRALAMNGSRYILVEMPFFGRPNYVESVLFDLQVRGLIPVLAHPDRIEAFQKEPDFLVDLVERGMLTQITAGSIVGHFGGRVKRFTETLLRRGLCHILASDTHLPRGPRSPQLRYCVEAAEKLVGPERARAMVVERPRAILANLDVTVEPPGPAGGESRWWRFWKSG